jgi:Na+-translocating ferredoxin:NAD+ oxidoreductase RnfC subunit
MLSINLIKNNMNYKTTFKIIVTGLLFGFSITDASAQVVKKIGQNSFTINPKAVLELESTSKGSTSSNEC